MELDGPVEGASWRWPLLISVVILNVRIFRKNRDTLILSITFDTYTDHMAGYLVQIHARCTPPLFNRLQQF